jgi:hypothetical protein
VRCPALVRRQPSGDRLTDAEPSQSSATTWTTPSSKLAPISIRRSCPVASAAGSPASASSTRRTLRTSRSSAARWSDRRGRSCAPPWPRRDPSRDGGRSRPARSSGRIQVLTLPAALQAKKRHNFNAPCLPDRPNLPTDRNLRSDYPGNNFCTDAFRRSPQPDRIVRASRPWSGGLVAPWRAA